MATATKAKPTLKIQPLEDRVVISAVRGDRVDAGRAVHPRHRQGKADPGRSRSPSGPGRFEKGARIPMELKVGDQVIYGKYSGTPFTLDGDEYLIIKASDVLAKIG